MLMGRSMSGAGACVGAIEASRSMRTRLKIGSGPQSFVPPVASVAITLSLASPSRTVERGTGI